MTNHAIVRYVERVMGDTLTLDAIRKKLERRGVPASDRNIANALRKNGITSRYIEEREFKIPLGVMIGMGCRRIRKGNFSFIIDNGIVVTVQRDTKRC